MQSEKAVSAKDGSNTYLKNKLTMNKLPNFQFKSNADGDRSRRELLDQTKLSRLPERKPFSLPTAMFPKQANVVCVGCGGRLETDNDFLQSVEGCRKCLGIYARLDAAFDESAKRKRREHLEKFAEVK